MTNKYFPEFVWDAFIGKKDSNRVRRLIKFSRYSTLSFYNFFLFNTNLYPCYYHHCWSHDDGGDGLLSPPMRTEERKSLVPGTKCLIHRSDGHRPLPRANSATPATATVAGAIGS